MEDIQDSGPSSERRAPESPDRSWMSKEQPSTIPQLRRRLISMRFSEEGESKLSPLWTMIEFIRSLALSLSRSLSAGMKKKKKNEIKDVPI